MPPTRSPEIEAVARRALAAFSEGDLPTLENLVSSDPALRVMGFDVEEWWKGAEEFISIRRKQAHESPEFRVIPEEVEAFEEGTVGWATVFSTIVTSEARTPMRNTAVLLLEMGSWRIIHWQNSIPVPNQQIFGVDLTRTLDDLVTSVLEGDHAFAAEQAPEGTMTLVFTDIVDSTTLAESIGDTAWVEIVAGHEATIRRITAAHGGSVVKMLGDGSMLAFASARAAVRAAIEIQRASASNGFAIRIGIHTGEVVLTGDDLLGLTVNKAARIAASSDDGGIMVSSTTRDLVGSLPGVHTGEPRTTALKGLSGTHQIIPVTWN